MGVAINFYQRMVSWGESLSRTLQISDLVAPYVVAGFLVALLPAIRSVRSTA